MTFRVVAPPRTAVPSAFAGSDGDGTVEADLGQGGRALHDGGADGVTGPGHGHGRIARGPHGAPGPRTPGRRTRHHRPGTHRWWRGRLPVTGGATGALALGGVAAMLAGMLALATVRRRRA